MLILKSLYFFLPAYIANMMPVLMRKVPLLGMPISEKLFGENKTWRGLAVAPLAGIIIFALQKFAYNKGFVSLALIDYAGFSILLGLLLGLGAILGDLVKSYYKRKAGVAPGHPLLVWDQLDFVVGGVLFSLFLYVPPAEVVFILVVISPLLHLGVNYLGYLLGIRKSRY